MKMVYGVYESPIGPIYVVLDCIGVKKIILTHEMWEECKDKLGEIILDPNECRQVINQLDEYFAGKRERFTVPLSLAGTDFYQQVWKELMNIPYGETKSYTEIAAAVGRPKSCRAVGQANRNNPVPIIIPCHRVVGKKGELTGYLGDKITMKKYLLQMEQSSK